MAHSGKRRYIYTQLITGLIKEGHDVLALSEAEQIFKIQGNIPIVKNATL